MLWSLKCKKTKQCQRHMVIDSYDNRSFLVMYSPRVIVL